ncbi:caspase family protein [Pseudorhodobacter sp.]|uniref:caspase family protein n=1 Tax=Pseudorhodobacter sp. TaxID=1934400 RepID=UPI0026470E3D|nr:caspase family protein [Pseudorhodobacter sp.]MDN5788026.1 caspase family protein [Pseudorhodobacter sp.]
MLHQFRFLFSGVLFAALTLLWPDAALAKRVALVIGMAKYQHIESLDNTANDARLIADTLRGIGFDVTLVIDAGYAELSKSMDSFAFDAETAELALIYFAGHGIEVQGENYLVPIDADVRSNRDVQRQSVSLDNLLATVDRARVMRIVVLDSCRNNPFGDAIDATAKANAKPVGLAPANPERGTLVAYAARDGQVALDGNGANSPFALALADRMKVPGLEISLMFRQVRDEVLAKTFNQQEPHTYGSLSGVPFYLAGPAEGDAPASGDLRVAWSGVRPDQEKQLIALAELGDTRSMVGLAYMRLNPEAGRFDPAEAFGLLSRAAKAGSPEAEFELAKLYERGLGVPQNYPEALRLYQAAADQNFADAINDLGFLYYQGELGLKQDPATALKLFERAADLRHPQALFNFSALIDDGLIKGKGPKDAAKYLYAALRSGAKDVLDLLEDRPNMFSVETRRELQKKLAAEGFYSGEIDGNFGPGTQKAARLAFGLTA